MPGCEKTSSENNKISTMAYYGDTIVSGNNYDPDRFLSFSTLKMATYIFQSIHVTSISLKSVSRDGDVLQNVIAPSCLHDE
jgi:hypothetical protein